MAWFWFNEPPTDSISSVSLFIFTDSLYCQVNIIEKLGFIFLIKGNKGKFR